MEGNGVGFNVTNTNYTFNLPAHSYKVFINQNVNRETSVVGSNALENNNEPSLSVYPNPVNTGSLVKYELPSSGLVNMRLMNVQGQVLASRNLGFQMKGAQIISLSEAGFNVNQLISGTYLLQLQVDKSVQMIKISVQK
jgi:hypothetical protein